jgi:16S rRNA (cytosine1402-N4)-methyltransferase
MTFHQPVLLDAVVHWINVQTSHGIYCDCTVGGAGHLLALLDKSVGATFIGIDWDPEAIAYARAMIMPHKERCFLFEDSFVNLGLILDRLKIDSVDGVLFDLGVSYHQVTTPERGFSFDRPGKLQMHMSPHTSPLAEKLHRAPREEIIKVLRQYGDVRNARKIGTAIFENKKSLVTTLDLRYLLEKIIPRRYLKKNLHKIFQALRIWTNNELRNLEIGIAVALTRLKQHGRIVVISYHSGEDRIVKNFFREAQKKGEMRILNKKVIRPSKDEVEKNPRARSAKLRAGEKCVVS